MSNMNARKRPQNAIGLLLVFLYWMPCRDPRSSMTDRLHRHLLGIQSRILGLVMAQLEKKESLSLKSRGFALPASHSLAHVNPRAKPETRNGGLIPLPFIQPCSEVADLEKR